MKSLAELAAIREKTLESIVIRTDNSDKIRIVVGMATCGIAAGARPVINKFSEEVSKRNLANVTVSQAGCIGMCRLEPLVEVYMPSGDKYTYINIDSEKVVRIVNEHIVNNIPVSEYLISNS